MMFGTLLIAWPWLQQLVDFLSDRFNALLDALNPVQAVINVATALASLLPLPAVLPVGAGESWPTILATVDSIAYFMSFFDYFIDLPVYLATGLAMLTFELGLGAFRTWRSIRSLIT
jgi:hypothetical protein